MLTSSNSLTVSCPALKGDDRYYFTYNSGLQAQPVIYRFPKGQGIQPPKEGEPGGELFFDVSGRSRCWVRTDQNTR
jgi:prolyl oligopeptidase